MDTVNLSQIRGMLIIVFPLSVETVLICLHRWPWNRYEDPFALPPKPWREFLLIPFVSDLRPVPPHGSCDSTPLPF